MSVTLNKMAPEENIDRAHASDGVLEAHLAGSGADGSPVYASVRIRPPGWQLVK